MAGSIVSVFLLALAGCSAGDQAPPVEAEETLDAFWSAFDEQYALFDLRLPGDDWAELGEDARAQLAAADADGRLTDDVLFDVLIGLARHLDDGHVDLTADDLARDEDAWVSAYPEYDALYELEDNAELEYLDQDQLARAAEDEISWGTIGGDVGYVSITAMEGLSPDADPEAGDQDDHGVEDAAAHAAMAAVLADLHDVRGMIVDVRANEGGWDTVALEIATWFAGARTLAWSEQRRNGPAHDDFGDWEDTYVEAAQPEAYGGPVVLLTSGGTFSAGEVFVLAMRARDRVTVIGEPTSGHFSDQLEGTLPNGWTYDLSNERYRAADGIIYETRGAPVDQPVPFDVAALNQGQDTILDAALDFIRQ